MLIVEKSLLLPLPPFIIFSTHFVLLRSMSSMKTLFFNQEVAAAAVAAIK